MRRTAAALATALVMGLLLWNGLRRGPDPSPDTPPASADNVDANAEPPDPYAGAAARVDALLTAARDGDLPAYLGAFDGPLRDRLERQVRESGADAFAADLRRAASARKGHAVFAPEPDGPAAARVVVEAVYPDRNERQTYRLERRDDDSWVVADVETLRGHTPQAKYGDPATYQAPEGAPVSEPSENP